MTKRNFESKQLAKCPNCGYLDKLMKDYRICQACYGSMRSRKVVPELAAPRPSTVSQGRKSKAPPPA